ncbi:MAG: hypothetical protein ACRDP6_13105 [Actinoallomurus sp.]
MLQIRAVLERGEQLDEILPRFGPAGQGEFDQQFLGSVRSAIGIGNRGDQFDRLPYMPTPRCDVS